VVRADGSCTCGVVSQSAVWCNPCNAEQDVLVPALAADPHFCVFNVLLEGPIEGTPAVADDLATWNDRHHQNFPIVLTTFTSKLHLPTPNAIPTNTIFDPKTMKILQITQGLPTIDDITAVCKGQ